MVDPLILQNEPTHISCDSSAKFVEETFIVNSMMTCDKNLPSFDGEGSETFKSAVTYLVKLNSVDILAICEPRVQFLKSKTALLQLGFTDFKIAEANGFSGGLWLLWNKNKVLVDYVDHNSQSISVKISLLGKPDWLLTVVYGSPTHTIRANLWSYFEDLFARVNLPNMLIGDFNELVATSEKSYGSLSGRFGGMREWINRSAMIDMGFFGSCYTWSNKRVKERLDRGLCSCSWRSSVPEAFISHLPRTRFDHCPILMQLQSNNYINRNAVPFRFQAMWFSHDSYAEFVVNTWNSLSGPFSSKIKKMAAALSNWNKEVFGHLFQKKKKLLARIGGIQRARDRYENPFLINLEAELIHEYEKIRDQECIFWKQKSRDNWIQGGDRNTKYFHLTTLVRRRKNKIEGLFDCHGNWFVDADSMTKIAVGFFSDLFSQPDLEDSRITIPWLFYEIENESLLQTAKHVTLIESSSILVGLNHTILALIPKTDGPQHMVNFRPISLCTTVYKIISKIIVARIRPLMQDLISPNQVSYVPRRQISDNIMIAHEVLFKFKKSSGKLGFFAWKVNLSKAYDRLNWNFIEMSVVDYHKWKPVSASQSGPKISHLFFVDDLMLFAEATPFQAFILKKYLDTLCALSRNIAYTISKTCGSPITEDLGKYLGMPLIHSRTNKFTYIGIVDKVQNRLSSWKSKVVTMAGRLTLVQSVTFDIPFYAMQTAKLPISLCEKIDKLNRDFIWGDIENKRRVHLMNWDTICRPKQLGGLGIKKTAEMNQAILAKIGWRLFLKDSGLWANMFSSKYLVHGSLFESDYKPPSNRSSSWRSVMAGAILINKNLKWRISNGKCIKFWYDFWLFSQGLRKFSISDAVVNDYTCISDFWDDEGWSFSLLSVALPTDIVGLIMNVPAAFDDSIPDSRIWGSTSNGTFSVKSAYNSLFDLTEPVNPQWKTIWSLSIPPKLKTFFWTVLHKKLLTNVQRATRGFTHDKTCPICHSGDETLLHLLRDCPRAMLIWKSFLKPGNLLNSFTLDWNGWIYAQLHCHSLVRDNIQWCILFIFICWFIWKWRNKQIFESNFVMPICFEKIIWEYAIEWKNAQNRASSSSMFSYTMLSWKMPPENFFKLNTDGTRATVSGKIGAGGVIRDHLGIWITGFQVNLGIGEILDTTVNLFNLGIIRSPFSLSLELHCLK
ncbi:uncharacterized protein LOC126802738 [Argentina anserina]|uniref:uncharacterized protein LOC126802738 n=1 Tax=Argentina anserina TaxID=57926 RepID=UPI0021764F1F|nr:uncharacterized protein LOC126802738 [Potentilla anserina]